MPVPNSPAIVFVPPNVVFGSENIGGSELPATPYMTYSGGQAQQASGFSSYMGQVVLDEVIIQPFNQCSGTNPSPPAATPINLAY